MRKICVVLGVLAAMITITAVVIWHANTTPIHSVEDEDGILYVTLLRAGAIVDVSITPSKERIHLDIRYDTGVTRHVDVETHGKPILISPVRIIHTYISANHFTDRSGARWNLMGDTPFQGVFPEDTTFDGSVGYVPALDRCVFLGPIKERWELQK